MKRFLCLGAMLAGLLAFALQHTASAAGFDCSKAVTLQEQAICNTPSLSAKDEQLNALFRPLKKHQVFRQLGATWLYEVRNACQTIGCLEAAYDQQIKRLTPQPLPRVDVHALSPLPEGQVYTQVDDEPWQRYVLAELPQAPAHVFKHIVDAAVVDGVLHVILYVSNSNDRDNLYLSERFNHQTYGTLYEYTDTRPGWHPIATHIAFKGWEKTGFYDQGKRYAGVVDGVFYYRQQEDKGLQQAMAYTLGSGAAPQPTAQTFQVPSSTAQFAKARILGDINGNNSNLTLSYDERVDRHKTERVMANDATDWSLVNPTWSERRAVLYFDNSGAMACVWRVDLVNKVLSKIVPEHEAVSARPVELLGQEALVYLEENRLGFAIAPVQ